MAREKPIVVINREARMASMVGHAVHSYCKEKDFLCRLVPSAALCDTLESLRDNGVDWVIVGGGDGSLRSAAQVFIGSDVRLGFLPLGTTNNTVRNFSIPVDWHSAFEGAVHWQAERVPVGMVNDHVFLNTATLGIAERIAREVPDHYKRRLGRLAYPLVGLRALRRHRPFQCTIAHADHTATYHMYQLLITNGRHVAGIDIHEPGAEREPALRVMSIGAPPHPLWHALRTMRALLSTDLHSHDMLLKHTVSCHIQTDPVVQVALDGEVCTHTPVECSVVEEAILLATPRLSSV